MQGGWAAEGILGDLKAASDARRRLGNERLNGTVRISVAMATYNGERYIRELLDSLARQTHALFELVITDDGSTDSTLDIAADFARSAPFPVHIHRNVERLKHTRNFLRAASLCVGDWIAFCDQDDVWLDHKLSRVSESISLHPEAILVQHSGIMVDEKLAPTGIMAPHFLQDAILPPICESGFTEHKSYLGFSMIFRAGLIRDYTSIALPEGTLYDNIEGEETFGHDKYIHFLSEILGHIVHIAEPLVLYRRHAEAVSFSFYNPISMKSRGMNGDLISKMRSNSLKKKEQLIRWERQSRQISMILRNAVISDTLLAKRVELAIVMYLERADLFCLRIGLYNKSRSKRLNRFLALFKASAYKSRRKGGLGSAGFISDVLKVVFEV